MGSLAAITVKMGSKDPWWHLEVDLPATLDVYGNLSNGRWMFRTLSTRPAKSISLTTPAVNTCCLCALEKKNRRVPFAAYRSVFSSPRCTVDLLANTTLELVIICSIAAHAGPRGAVQLAVAYHPSASATECGYRADRPRDRAH
jgi:hypothetical protein